MRPDAPETPAHLQVHDGLAIAQNGARTLLPHANTTVSRGRKIADCHVIDQRRRSGLISVIVLSCLKVGKQPSSLKQQQSCKPSALSHGSRPRGVHPVPRSKSAATAPSSDRPIFHQAVLAENLDEDGPLRTDPIHGGCTCQRMAPRTAPALDAPNVAGHALVKLIRRSSTSQIRSGAGSFPSR